MNHPVEIGVDVSLAASHITQGNLVAIPTETVYGLAADALNRLAVAKIFEAKQRPRFDPLIVHVASHHALAEITKSIPPVIQRLIDEFWPGPLTVILPKKDSVPDLVTSGLDTVAIRMPDHPLALQLIEQSGKPLAAPSANLFGRTSPTTASHVAEQLEQHVAYILDGGPCRVGIESTIVRLIDDRLSILRPGGITIEQIESVIGRETVTAAGGQSDDKSDPGHSPIAPGQLKEHYAPLTRLVIAQKPVRPAEFQRVGLLTLQLENSADCAEKFDAVRELSPTGDLTEAASNFFSALRQLDAMNLDLIVATPFPSRGLGIALNDRLQRAAR